MSANLLASLGLPYSALPLLVLALSLFAGAPLIVLALFDLPDWAARCAAVLAIVFLGMTCAMVLSST